MFLTGPAVVRDVMGEDVTAADLGGYKVHERNGVAHFVTRDDADAAELARELIDHLPSHAGERAPTLARERPARLRRRRARARRRAQGLRRARRHPRHRRLRAACSSTARAGRATSSAASPASTARSVGVIANQPKYLGGVLDAGVGLQGRPLRAHLQRVRAPAGRARRHPRLHARHQAGAGRRDPPRRQARARVLRGDRAEGHRRAAQGVRRRVHRHELARPRRGLRVRVAAGDARRDGRQAGRRASSTGATSPPPRIPRPCATSSPSATRAST